MHDAPHLCVPIRDNNLVSQTLSLFHRQRIPLSVQASQIVEALRVTLTYRAGLPASPGLPLWGEA